LLINQAVSYREKLSDLQIKHTFSKKVENCGIGITEMRRQTAKDSVTNQKDRLHQLPSPSRPVCNWEASPGGLAHGNTSRFLVWCAPEQCQNLVSFWLESICLMCIQPGDTKPRLSPGLCEPRPAVCTTPFQGAASHPGVSQRKTFPRIKLRWLCFGFLLFLSTFWVYVHCHFSVLSAPGQKCQLSSTEAGKHRPLTALLTKFAGSFLPQTI